MKRFNADIRSLQSVLEQAPEVFERVCMNITLNVHLGMVYSLVNVSVPQQLGGTEAASADCSLLADLLFPQNLLHCFSLRQLVD